MSLEPSKVYYSENDSFVYFVLSVLNGVVFTIRYNLDDESYSVKYNETSFFNDRYKEAPEYEKFFHSLQINRDGYLYDIMKK